MTTTALLALADLHRSTPVDAEVEVALPVDWSLERVADVIIGGGFTSLAIDEPRRVVRARRQRTLPDTVGASMRLLVCGLNPSLHAADAGVGFVTPGNRFWPAALDAGLVTRDRDPRHALVGHGVGMTDLVKRATPRADALTRDEYRAGVERIGRLCEWLQPRAICFVGLAGWRAAVDRKATPGWQDRPLGGRPVYVMPSTSGLNAATGLGDLTQHLRLAGAGLPSTPG
ncbi:MAG: mismatch-specific DNA-glycosylase [Microthrixaceae bacterium]